MVHDCRNRASGQGCRSHGSMRFPAHTPIRGRMPLLRLDGISSTTYIRSRMPLLRLDEVSRHILTFAAGCRSYGLMVALPFLLISPAPLPPGRFKYRPLHAVIPASEARPESVLIGVRHKASGILLLTSYFLLLTSHFYRNTACRSPLIIV